MVQKGQPLKGRTIVVTRPRDQAAETMKAIEARGWKPYLLPAIEIQAPTDLSGVKPFFQALASKRADYVILMSVNGVKHLLAIAENMGILGEVKRNLRTTVVMAVGPKTAQELENNGVRVDIIPDRYTSEGILQCLQQNHVKGKTIFIPRTNEAPPELAEELRQMGNRVEDIYVYHSQLPSDKALAKKFVNDLTGKKIGAILFTSALGVRNFFELLKPMISQKKLKDLIETETTIAAIGPITAKALTEMGLKVDVMPQTHTVNETLNALADFWSRKK